MPKIIEILYSSLISFPGEILDIVLEYILYGHRVTDTHGGGSAYLSPYIVILDDILVYAYPVLHLVVIKKNNQTITVSHDCGHNNLKLMPIGTSKNKFAMISDTSVDIFYITEMKLSNVVESIYSYNILCVLGPIRGMYWVLKISGECYLYDEKTHNKTFIQSTECIRAAIQFIDMIWIATDTGVRIRDHTGLLVNTLLIGNERRSQTVHLVKHLDDDDGVVYIRDNSVYHIDRLFNVTHMFVIPYIVSTVSFNNDLVLGCVDGHIIIFTSQNTIKEYRVSRTCIVRVSELPCGTILVAGDGLLKIGTDGYVEYLQEENEFVADGGKVFIVVEKRDNDEYHYRNILCRYF